MREKAIYPIARRLPQSGRIRLLELLSNGIDDQRTIVWLCFGLVSFGQANKIATIWREEMINCLSWYAVEKVYDR